MLAETNQDLLSLPAAAQNRAGGVPGTALCSCHSSWAQDRLSLGPSEEPWHRGKGMGGDMGGS